MGAGELFAADQGQVGVLQVGDVEALGELRPPARLDTAMLHKIAMGVATAGMVTQIALGFVTASKEGTVAQRDYALAHQIIGFTTFAATATGFAVLTF